MLRNPNSPYGGTVTAGMDKNYHYDRNLDGTPPPFYPEAAYDNESGELEVNLVGFKKVE